MLVPETLLRMLVRFPKLLITIAKRCSSTTIYFLRYIFSLWNVSIQKLGERKHFTKGKLDNSPPSALPCKDREKDREVEASAGSATILCSRDRPADREALGGRTPQMRCCKPPLRQPMSSFDRLAGILSMVLGFDHPGFIGRSLGATQQSKAKRERDRQRQAMQQDDPNRDHETDVKKWEKFGDTFQKDVENINLLATVLLTANFSFLAIQSIDQRGLSYWPQRLSYTSLLSAMGSILMGLAVRTPRFFTAYSSTYFKVMASVLGFPFELFLYSVFLFIAALVVHFSINDAKFQYGAAILIFSLVIVCLGMYWLVTEPQEEQLICSGEGSAGRGAEAV